MIQAGAMGKPIVATDRGVIGWMTRHHELGPTVDVNSPAAVVGAVSELVRWPAIAANYGIRVDGWRQAIPVRRSATASMTPLQRSVHQCCLIVLQSTVACVYWFTLSGFTARSR